MGVERPIFGKPERRRKLLPSDPNQEILATLRLEPLIRESLAASMIAYEQAKIDGRKRQQEIAELVWGKEAYLTKYISPATASKCLKWMGYEILEEKPVKRAVEEGMILGVGSALHNLILRPLRSFGLVESPFVRDDFSGRTDFLLKNPKTREFQILELKTTGSWAFRQINREGLPAWMRIEKNLYNPRPEDRLQLLLYMWAKRQEGLAVTCGNIIYVDRDAAQMKECLILWDEIAEYEIEEFLKKARKAKEAIENGELPQASVDPKSAKYLCGRICPYKVDCGVGKQFAAKQVRIESKKKPPWVYKKAKERKEELKKKMEEAGFVQPQLPGLHDNSEKELPKESFPRFCGDCGTEMYRDEKEARGGRYVCPNCGNP